MDLVLNNLQKLICHKNQPIFYNEQSSLVRHIAKRKVIIIGEGINAQIGKDANNFKNILGNPSEITDKATEKNDK